jgi:multiple sugar transport system permease protein
VAVSALEPAVARPRPRAASLASVGYWVVALVLVGLFLFPLLWTLLRSLQGPGADAVRPTLGALSHLTLASYTRLLSTGSGLWHYVANSAIVAVMTALLTAVVSTIAGYGFSRTRFRGRGALFIVILMPVMIPFQGILTPLFTVLTWLHLSNTLPGLIVIYSTFQLPFSVFIMRNSFSQVPLEIEEAALVDGASTAQSLTRVMLPLVKPGVVTVALYGFLFGWNEFLAALILNTSDSRFTLPVALNNLQSGVYGSVDLGLLDAGAIVAAVPCLAIFVLLQRYYVQGLAAGAVKG